VGVAAGTGERRSVVLGVTGSVAAFKAADIAAYLRRAGVRVRPVLTQAATRFVTPLTLAALAGEEALTDLWTAPERPLHLELARADLFVVAPATADFLARAAAGRADDLLAAALLARAAGRPVLFAPAMESELWAHPFTQAHVAALRGLGHAFIGPVAGPLASGGSGMGRMAAVDDIVGAALDLLADRDLAGLRLVVTAGPTQEPVDAVRYVGNRSSGRMGYAVARRAIARGARVTLVSGPVALAPPPGARLVPVATAAEMAAAVAQATRDADAVVAAAAVADYRPVAARTDKMRRSAERLTLELERTEDVLATAAALPGRETRVLVGFAAEVGDPTASALDKCRRKGLDLCVGNDIADPDSTFGSPADRVVLAWPDGRVEPLPLLPKEEVADRLLDELGRLWRLRRPPAMPPAAPPA
jgi:phosphopantothenoylcysteine decarboxylase/phosphopantothenate--cysteine ligase